MNFFTRRRFDLVHDLSASARKQSVMEYRLPRMDVGGGGGWRRCSTPLVSRQRSNAPPWILMNSLWTGCGLPLSEPLREFTLEAFFRDSVCHFQSGIFSRGEARVRVAERWDAPIARAWIYTLVCYYANRKRIFKWGMFVRSTVKYIRCDQDYSTSIYCTIY